MTILGIKYPGHDAAAALVVDGEIAYASAQGRFDRIKHSKQFPSDAIAWCLSEASLGPDRVDAVAVQYDFWSAYRRSLIDLPKQFGLRAFWASAQNVGDDVRKHIRTFAGVRRSLGVRARVFLLDHHDCHAASAFFASPFDTAAVMTVDGRGERDTARLYSASADGLRQLASIRFPHSLGLMYSKVTSYLGFRSDCDEGTVMALAAYGDNRFDERFRRLITFDEGFRFRLALDRFAYHLNMRCDVANSFIGDFGARRQPDEEINSNHSAIAYALQRTTEAALQHLGRAAYDTVRSPNLCFAGGVALNAVANGHITNALPFKSIFVQPAAGDDGSAVGAALLLHHLLSGTRAKARHWWTPYLGYESTQAEIEAALDAASCAYVRVTDPCETAARLLAEGHVIGWYQGRAEFGPRALGNRSILAPACALQFKERVNRIKRRAQFRPFAPAVLEEEMPRLFEFWMPSPYMTFAYRLRSSAASLVPAVVHRDGTSRVQTVSSKTNPRLYAVLRHYRAQTGLGVLLNTSLNGPNDPIANNAGDAVRLFVETEMDALVIGNFVTTKASAALVNRV
jgi:carbamoyltransferase